jgi:hypothetical protein
VWRTPLIYRLFFPAVGLSFLVVAIASFVDGSDLAFAASMFLMGVVLTVGPFRPVVRLEGQEVYARGLVVDRRIPLRDIDEVEGGYDGLAFRTRDGRHFVATGVGEKMNITRWLGRRGKADSIADTIRDARERVLADTPVDQRESRTPAAPPEPGQLPAYVTMAQVVGGAVFLLGAYLAFVSDTYVDAGLPLMVAGTLVPLVLFLAAARTGGPSAGGGD